MIFPHADALALLLIVNCPLFWYNRRPMRVRLSLFAVIVLALFGPVFPAAAQGEHLVLGLYYNWYDEKSFGPKKTSDQPETPYKSSDPTIGGMSIRPKRAGLDGFIVSWYGPRDAPDNQTEANLRTAGCGAEKTSGSGRS
jgi:hypothetical protein